MKNIENLDGEIWADIIGYEGIYKISKNGLVLSMRREYRHNRNKKIAIRKERLMSINIGIGGYKFAQLSKNSLVTSHTIHRLVALNFIPNPEGKKQVNHINGIKTDNRCINLEWVTCSENNLHAVKIGLLPKGEKHHLSKFGQKESEAIKALSDKGLSQRHIASLYNISQGLVWNILNKKARWKQVQ